MTKEEYIKRMHTEDDWAPGWDAIDTEFDRLYPGKEPAHYGTEIHARAMFGGNNYLDGYSVYDSGKGYQHIVTFGMSELYTDEEAFGREYSRWGYEMTIKLKENKPEDCLWALDTLHGMVEFIQFVGITEAELNAVREDQNNISILIERMKKDNPELVTDMQRKNSYF